MIKLQDFARQHNVTDRAIQKHLKKYEAELEGHFERRGPNGTWIDDVGCAILRSKMKQQQVAVFEEDPRLEEYAERVRELEKMLTLAQQQTQAAQAQVAQLQEASAKVALLEADNEAARVARAEAEERANVAERERKNSEEALEQMRREAQFRADKAQAAEEQRIEAERRLEERERELEKLRNAGFFKRVFGWNKTKEH